MLKIGDFSKLSRITIRMLRYYDEIDLLKPLTNGRGIGTMTRRSLLPQIRFNC